MMDAGIAMDAMMVPRQSCRNANTVMATSTAPRIR